jgi:hypothetical protein
MDLAEDIANVSIAWIYRSELRYISTSICNWPSLEALQTGGYNTLLGPEEKKLLPRVSEVPTCIFGLDVYHGSPGDTNSPSLAAVRTVVCNRKLECQLELSCYLSGGLRRCGSYVWNFSVCFRCAYNDFSFGW